GGRSASPRESAARAAAAVVVLVLVLVLVLGVRGVRPPRQVARLPRGVQRRRHLVGRPLGQAAGQVADGPPQDVGVGRGGVAGGRRAAGEHVRDGVRQHVGRLGHVVSPIGRR